MYFNEEDPGNLGGLGNMLPADVLKKVNELLEQLHRKDKDHQGSTINLTYVAPGAQYVNRIDTQIFGADKSQSQNLPVHQPVNHPNYQNH